MANDLDELDYFNGCPLGNVLKVQKINLINGELEWAYSFESTSICSMDFFLNGKL